MKNLTDFRTSTPTYWILGFGPIFAGAGPVTGGLDPFVRGDYSGILPAGAPLFAYLIFQTVFCATSTTYRFRFHGRTHEIYFLRICAEKGIWG